MQNNTNVEWFFKNGTQGKEIKYFSISYKADDGDRDSFYIDWIVKWKCGMVGLYDTKYGTTAKYSECASKVDTLYKYVKKVSKNIFIHGGIIAESNGLFYINCCKKKDYKYNLLDSLLNLGWENFDINYSFNKNLSSMVDF